MKDIIKFERGKFMKKIITLMLAVMTVGAVFVGCSKKEQPSSGPMLKDGESLKSVYEGISADFTTTHGEDIPMMAMPMEFDDSLMTDLVGINMENVDSYYAVTAGMMPNFAEYISIKAKEGKASEVAEQLSKRKADLESQYEMYNVMGNYDRAKAAEVYVKGDYVFLIAVGASDPDNEETGGSFIEDVAAAKKVIDSKFE